MERERERKRERERGGREGGVLNIQNLIYLIRQRYFARESNFKYFVCNDEKLISNHTIKVLLSTLIMLVIILHYYPQLPS